MLEGLKCVSSIEGRNDNAVDSRLIRHDHASGIYCLLFSLWRSPDPGVALLMRGRTNLEPFGESRLGA